MGEKAQSRAESQDDQSNFPSFDDTEDKGDNESDVGLNQHRCFVTNSFLDFMDITAKKKRQIRGKKVEDTHSKQLLCRTE